MKFAVQNETLYRLNHYEESKRSFGPMMVAEYRVYDYEKLVGRWPNKLEKAAARDVYDSLEEACKVLHDRLRSWETGIKEEQDSLRHTLKVIDGLAKELWDFEASQP